MIKRARPAGASGGRGMGRNVLGSVACSHFTTSLLELQCPNLSLALDAALADEELYGRAAANLFAEARRLALLAITHARAADAARARRAALEEMIPANGGSL